MIDRETVHDWTVLESGDVRAMVLAVAAALGFAIVKVTDDEWPEGHPDRVRFEVEKI